MSLKCFTNTGNDTPGKHIYLSWKCHGI